MEATGSGSTSLLHDGDICEQLHTFVYFALSMSISNPSASALAYGNGPESVAYKSRPDCILLFYLCERNYMMSVAIQYKILHAVY